MSDLLDKQVLDELRASVGGDQAFFAELVDEFLGDAPDQLATLREAAAAGDAEVAQRSAHTLKSNARTFGASELAALCLEAEMAAANGDLESVRPRIDEIAEAWERVRDELASARNG